MTTDNRMTWGLIIDVLDLLERHGYHQHDTSTPARPSASSIDLTRVYEGDRDAPHGTHLDQAPPSPPSEPRRPDRQADPGAFVLTGTDISTVLTALHMAADDKRDRAETCADCPDLSCPACQSPSPGRPGLRPADRPDTPASRGPGCSPRSPRARQLPPLPGPDRSRSRNRGRPVTLPGKPPDEPGTRRQAPRSPCPRPAARRREPAAGEGELRELRTTHMTLRRSPMSSCPGHQPAAEYAIVVDQRRGWQPGGPPSLAELLENLARTREPEPDLEAEP